MDLTRFILEVRSSLPPGDIIRWSHFTPDTQSGTPCGTAQDPRFVPLAGKHFLQAAG